MAQETASAVLDRSRFRKEGASVALFLVIVTLPTLWLALRPQTPLLAIGGTIVAEGLVGLIGWWFLRREGVRASDIGFGRRQWVHSLVLFAAWWIVLTAVDVLAKWGAAQMGGQLAPIEVEQWTPTLVLDLAKTWLVVGFAEEIAMRGYLHNKLVTLLGRRWLAAALGAAIFGLWHIPGLLVSGNGNLVGLLAQAAVFAVLSFICFNGPYEWTGLLPFLGLFHGWNDFLLTATFEAPTGVGIAFGYLSMLALLVAYGWWQRRQIVAQASAGKAAEAQPIRPGKQPIANT
ncbi:MAG: CPBP family intramembrane glutamic endopeptidase [Chloroflexota bacterium]